MIGNVAFAIFPLERLSNAEIEALIMNKKSHVKGGEWGFCPISHNLIRIPVRGINCSHKDNFDLFSYIDLSTRIRTWECPICERKLPFEEICLDEDAYGEMIKLSLKNPDFAMKSIE